MPETPVAAKTRDQRDIGTISVPGLPVPDQTHHQTGRMDRQSVATILASHWAISLAIMVGGAIGIIITLFDPVRRDAMLGLWRQATVWLFAN